MRRRRAIALVLALSLGVGSCADDDGTSPVARASTFSFDLGPTFVGERYPWRTIGDAVMRNDGSLPVQDWVAAYVDSGGLVVVAFFPDGVDPHRGDVVVLRADGSAPGTRSCGPVADASAECSALFLTYVHLRDASPFGVTWESTGGTVTIEEVHDDRVVGSFAIEMVDLDMGTSRRTLERGRFDALWTPPGVRDAVACFLARAAEGATTCS